MPKIAVLLLNISTLVLPPQVSYGHSPRHITLNALREGRKKGFGQIPLHEMCKSEQIPASAIPANCNRERAVLFNPFEVSKRGLC